MGRPVEASATLIYLSAPAARKFLDTISNASGDGSLIAGGPKALALQCRRSE